MTTTTRRIYRRRPGPLHATLLAGTVPLFLGGLLSDTAYYLTYETQWSNFASWLIAGGLLFASLALLFALVNLIRTGQRKRRPFIYMLLLLAICVVGFLNALEHAKDAWATMPLGLLLSVVVTVLACIATGLGLSNQRSGGVK